MRSSSKEGSYLRPVDFLYHAESNKEEEEAMAPTAEPNCSSKSPRWYLRQSRPRGSASPSSGRRGSPRLQSPPTAPPGGSPPVPVHSKYLFFAVVLDSLSIRNRPPVGPYSRAMPRALWWSWGGRRFLVSDVVAPVGNRHPLLVRVNRHLSPQILHFEPSRTPRDQPLKLN